MRRLYLVTIEVDETEHASLQAKRLASGRQQHTIDEDVELNLLAALNAKVYNEGVGHTCIPVLSWKKTLVASEDPNASA